MLAGVHLEFIEGVDVSSAEATCWNLEGPGFELMANCSQHCGQPVFNLLENTIESELKRVFAF